MGMHELAKLGMITGKTMAPSIGRVQKTLCVAAPAAKKQVSSSVFCVNSTGIKKLWKSVCKTTRNFLDSLADTAWMNCSSRGLPASHAIDMQNARLAAKAREAAKKIGRTAKKSLNRNV